MTTESIFNESTILRAITVWINDVELLNEDVMSVDMKWSFDGIAVVGKLLFKDTLEVASQKVFDGKTTVRIYVKDIYDEVFEKTFIVTDINNQESGDRWKIYSLTLIDRISFLLNNTYMSKGFNTDIVTAIDEVFTHLKIPDIMKEDKMEFIKGECKDISNIVIPQDRSLMEYFTDYLRYRGMRWWQTRSAFIIDKVVFNELEPIKDDEDKPIIYSNATTNQEYGFRINDFSTSYNDLLSMNDVRPVIKSYAYDFEKRSMQLDALNLTDVYDTIKMNDQDCSNLQKTTGARMDIQNSLNTDSQKLDIEDTYMINNILEIVVPGNFKYSRVGELMHVALKGNPLYTESALEGDTFHSGVFFISQIADKIIADKMIQKILLKRIDFKEPR
jgi:hypothetical protein